MVGVNPELLVEVRFLGGVPQRLLGVVLQGSCGLGRMREESRRRGSGATPKAARNSAAWLLNSLM